MERSLAPGQTGLHPTWSWSIFWLIQGPLSLSGSTWNRTWLGPHCVTAMASVNKRGPVSLKHDAGGFGEKHRCQEHSWAPAAPSSGSLTVSWDVVPPRQLSFPRAKCAGGGSRQPCPSPARKLHDHLPSASHPSRDPVSQGGAWGQLRGPCQGLRALACEWGPGAPRHTQHPRTPGRGTCCPPPSQPGRPRISNGR